MKKRNKGIYYVLPVLIVSGLLILFPLAYNVYISFTSSNIYSLEYTFVGLQNYKRLLGDERFINALKNTIVWSFSSVLFQVVLGLIAAIVINSVTKGQRIIQALIMVPWIIPGIAAASSWRWLYHPDFGFINYFIRSFGGKPVLWLGNPNLALPSVILVNIWKMYPFAALMLTAGLQSIPISIYEAAKIDGAGRASAFFRITLPMMRPILSVLSLLLTIWAFNAFDFIYTMTEGGPARSSEILGVRIYKDAMKSQMFGRAAAQAMTLFVLMLIFSIFYLKLTYKRSDE